MTKISTPTRFTNLHAHSVLSVGDAIGLPQEHMDFAIKNGMDSLALTDHGTMAGISHQQIYLKKLKEKGISFKAIPGVEAYFIDSLADWKVLLQVQKANKALAKTFANNKQIIGNEMADTESEMDSKHGKDKASDEEESGTVIEIESESKNTKLSDPITQRNHLVLLPKNNIGLKSIFEMVSESYIDGFYRYPRIDYDMLRKHAKGNVVATSACLGGRLSKIVFDNQDQNLDWREWQITNTNYDKILSELKIASDKFIDVMGGPENFYLELQFNKLNAQHLVNYYLIELAKQTDLKLVVTADSHYSNPEHWREREIYKAMAWASKTKGTIDPETLPKTIDELKCELYPKNAEQIWKSYLEQKNLYPNLYNNDELIFDAIERTHDIAHQLIGDVSVDSSVKLPAISRLIEKNALEKLLERSEGLMEDDIAFKQLVQLAINGLRKIKKNNDDIYINRLKYELETIKHLKFSKYFLTYHKIMEITGSEMLIGNGRGSAAGSLLSYVLNVTQVDPIRFGLLFERFLVKGKKCLLPTMFVKTSDGPKTLRELKVGDLVYTHTNSYKTVCNKESTYHKTVLEFELEDGTKLTSSPNHIWIVIRNGKQEEVRADEINEEDELIGMV